MSVPAADAARGGARAQPEFEIEARRLVRVHSVNVRGFAAMPIEFTPAG